MREPLVYLSADEVRRALPMREAIDAMREAFTQLARGEVTLPPRVRLDAEAHAGVALVMPCHSAAAHLFSLKSVTVYDRNRELGLPSIQSTVLLTDAATGTPLAILEGAALTALRTGAVSGLATELLARPDATAAAVFGAGVQARTQLEAVCCARPIQRAQVYARRQEAARRFAREMTGYLGLPVEPADTPAAALREADVVCTATPAAAPLFADAELAEGTHVNAVGSFRLNMVEIPAETVLRARVVVDQREAAHEEAGDLLQPLHAGLIDVEHFRTELGELLLGRAPGRRTPEEVTLFKSVGVAIQDLCAASRALHNARRLGLGTPLG